MIGLGRLWVVDGSCQCSGHMTSFNEMILDRVCGMWCIFSCDGCNVVTAILVSMYNACVVSILLMFVQGV